MNNDVKYTKQIQRLNKTSVQFQGKNLLEIFNFDNRICKKIYLEVQYEESKNHYSAQC